MRGLPGDVITAARARFPEALVGVALALVAFTTGFISYTHISALTENLGQSWKTAHLMPFAVDGQIVIGSVYYMENEGKRRRWLGLIGFVPGIAESLFANWESGIVHGLLAAAWATVPAQAFACSTVLFDLWLHSRRAAGRAARPAPVPAAAPPEAAPPEAVSQAPEPAAPAAPQAGPVPRAGARAPGGAPWGLVSPAAAPAPAPAPAPWPAALPGLPVPVVGPLMQLADRPRAARPRPQAAPAGERRPLPAGEALRELLASVPANQIAREYGVSRYAANNLKRQYAAGEIEFEEEVATDAA
jgi:Protein of unknown function (DUF2637)